MYDRELLIEKLQTLLSALGRIPIFKLMQSSCSIFAGTTFRR